MALCQRGVTAREHRDQLRATMGTLVSDQTVRNQLRANNLRARRPVVRPPLLQRDRAARRDWCTHHLPWQRAQWSLVLFSNEPRFTLQFMTAENMCTDVQERD
ncbi:hypothetical protein BaRGS_00020236 [Batillaria attramentaria]|uniref:Transposase Tc1-like domain-containing protein n=1 Tax=Batillaria attramentaria TaxID=370345 RepID=A0ABD0KNF7_9CAEN